MSGFRLTKWYLDCVTDTGFALIGYAALVRWRGVRLPLAGLLTYEGDRPCGKAHVSLCWHPPVGDAELVNWNCRAFDFTGTWRSSSPAIQRVLYQEGGNEIIWRCLQPASLANVEFGNGHVVGGRGYVECLEMTGLPWNMGLRHLRWGRFVSENESVIWIRWEGHHTRTYLIHNGRDVVGSVADDRIFSERQFDLHLSDPRLLRQGAIATTALKSIPLVRAILPRRLASIREEKWLSRGTMIRADGTTALGWAMHERVSFDA